MATRDQIEGQIRVLIADDHDLFRQGIRQMLQTDPSVEVVGEATTHDAAVALVLEHCPEVVLDLEMPGGEIGPTSR